MKSTIGQQLKALGRYKLPLYLVIDNNSRLKSQSAKCSSRFKIREIGPKKTLDANANDSVYKLKKIFKHDFFAITSLYQRQEPSHQNAANSPAKIVLKMNRKADFLGIPFQWLGVGICQNEVENLLKLKGIRGIPKYLGKYEKVGLIYEFIEGVSLDEKPTLPDGFFDELEKLLVEIHRRNIAYIDMNKQGNILLGCDNLPHIIDFQISQRIYWPVCFLLPLSRTILKYFQREDFYHLKKHKRRLAGHLMSEQEKRESRKRSFLIKLHRAIFRPLTRLRRKILGYLFKKDLLVDDAGGTTSETDPSRWVK